MGQSGSRIAGDERCYLEGLPPELIHAICEQLDTFEDMENLLLASKYVYRCFDDRRKGVLINFLRRKLGPVLRDARFLAETPRQTMRLFRLSDRQEYRRVTYARTNRYRDILSCSERKGEWRHYDLPTLCRNYRSIDFVARLYMSTQERWVENAGGKDNKPFSRIERLRILRALYRRQILYNIWEPLTTSALAIRDVAPVSNTNANLGAPPGFCSLFQPWEMQQIDHVDHYISRLCVALCMISSHLQKAMNEREASKAESVEARRKITEAVPRVAMDRIEFCQAYWDVAELKRYMMTNTRFAKRSLHIMPVLLEFTNSEILSKYSEPIRWATDHKISYLCSWWQLYRWANLWDPVRDVGGIQISYTGDDLGLPPFGWVDGLNGQRTTQFGTFLFVVSWAHEPPQMVPNLGSDEEESDEDDSDIDDSDEEDSEYSDEEVSDEEGEEDSDEEDDEEEDHGPYLDPGLSRAERRERLYRRRTLCLSLWRASGVCMWDRGRIEKMKQDNLPFGRDFGGYPVEHRHVLSRGWLLCRRHVGRKPTWIDD